MQAPPNQGPEVFRAHAMDVGLSEPDLDADPVRQFQQWYEAAIGTGIPEPNAMSLTTVDTDGQPSLRTVLLKLYDERGFVFFTNYESRKATEMAGNPRVACLFPWVALARQVNIVGQVEKISLSESLRYFATRPRGSQIGGWASHQSRPQISREDLLTRLALVEDRFYRTPVPRPTFWSGYRIVPVRVELWQGKPDRLHERRVWRCEGTTWVTETLDP